MASCGARTIDHCSRTEFRGAFCCRHMLRLTRPVSPRPTMNAPLTAPLLSAIEMAPRDPILGVTEAFNNDPNPRKVNLGVGVYTDDAGKVPLLECVRRAERTITERATPHVYLPID